MKTYKQIMSEMAIDIGKPFSMLHNRNGYAEANFESTKIHPVVTEIAPNLKLHKILDDNMIKFTVNDHANKQTLYTSTITHNKATQDVPFDHIEQTLVDRVKSSDKLPKNFATDFIYNHWKSQSLPLRSSSMQYHTGRDMWSRLIDKAHADGKHVFWIYDNGNGEEPVTKENKDRVMNDYFGKSSDHANRHLVLSHTEELPWDL